MALNSTPYPNISRVVSGAAILFPNDSIILCNTSSAPVTMTLQEIPANNWQTTWKLYVLDNSNNAGTFSITINAPSGYTINNASSLVINTNGGGVVITIASNTAFFGQVSPLPSGGGTVAASNTAGTVVANCTDFKFNSTNFNVTNPSGNIAEIQAVQLDGFLAVGQPPTLTRVLPLTANTIFTSGTTLLTPVSYDDGSDYNPLTGVWTCPADGRYNLSIYAHYSVSGGSWTGGMFTAGIMNQATTSQFCGAWATVTQPTQHIDVSANLIGLNITAGSTFCMVVLNQLDSTYNTVNGDIVRFSIQRIR
jgi:hypothetical protein